MAKTIHKNQTNTGSAANTQLQYTLDTFDYESLSLIFKIVEGTNFVSQNATIEASVDAGANYTTIDTIALGTGAVVVKSYTIATSIYPCAFPLLRITVPALGASKTARVIVSGRKKDYTKV